jgi:hypothetical protein
MIGTKFEGFGSTILPWFKHDNFSTVSVADGCRALANHAATDNGNNISGIAATGCSNRPESDCEGLDDRSHYVINGVGQDM